MPFTEQFGVVVVIEKTVVSGLAKLAQRHRWPLIHLATSEQVMKTIGRQRVDIAVIHIAVELEQSLELIQWLRKTRQDVLLIAAASAHREEAERMVRHAGAHCYLPQTDEVSLERAVATILQQESARLRAKQTTDTHERMSHRELANSAAARRGA